MDPKDFNFYFTNKDEIKLQVYLYRNNFNFFKKEAVEPFIGRVFGIKKKPFLNYHYQFLNFIR